MSTSSPSSLPSSSSATKRRLPLALEMHCHQHHPHHHFRCSSINCTDHRDRPIDSLTWNWSLSISHVRQHSYNPFRILSRWNSGHHVHPGHSSQSAYQPGQSSHLAYFAIWTIFIFLLARLWTILSLPSWTSLTSRKVLIPVGIFGRALPKSPCFAFSVFLLSGNLIYQWKKR